MSAELKIVDPVINTKDTKVLIIEDEAQITRLIELELKYEGYNVITATDGLEGLNSIRESMPDLVLLDCMLPNMSGEEVCRQVRNDLMTTPIIMITAKDSIEDKVKGLDYGADDYLVKPFATEELLARIRAVHPSLSSWSILAPLSTKSLAVST